MGILEQIKDIEHEMNRTQKNKATESHLGRLKGKLARLRSQLIEASAGGGGPKGPHFEVKKSGDVRVALIGFPSAGKSTLLGKVTKTKSETAAYEFTTLTCIPGVIHYKGTEIQLLDLPGIVEGAAEGRGRGKQVQYHTPPLPPFSFACCVQMSSACHVFSAQAVKYPGSLWGSN